jgi:phospholipid transport system substrate-binding protein
MRALSHVRRAVLQRAAAAILLALPATAVAREPAPVAPIAALNQALIEVMKAGRATPYQQRYQVLAPAIERALDLPYILRVSVGPAWRSLNPDQRQILLDVFRRYTVASYLDNFDKYNNQEFVTNPTTRPVGSNEQVVDTQIIPVRGERHRIDYVMRNSPRGWKAVDVLADGSISRVAVQRSDFSSLLTRGGVPALTASLQQKTEDLER